MSGWENFFDRPPPGAMISSGNAVEHLPHDNQALEMMWDAIDHAERRVWVAMFTLGADKVGLGTIDRLTGAARRGCDVRLVYDYLGSIHLRGRHTAPLTEAGGHLVVFNRVWPPWKKNGPLGIRNHRKLIIIDEDEAFCGGMNLSVDFANPWKKGDEILFDDTSVRVNGPCVTDLARIFQHTWSQDTGEMPKLPLRDESFPGELTIEVLQTDPRRPETRVIQVIGGAIDRAESEVRITTPYFVPPSWLEDALIRAMDRGARVEIVTAGLTDERIAQMAGRLCYGDLLQHGVKIYEMQGRVIHTKKMIVDGAFCAVGSYNFDIWTSRHVLDASIATVSDTLATSFEKEFDEDISYSEEITLDRWEHRSPWANVTSWACMQVCRHL